MARTDRSLRVMAHAQRRRLCGWVAVVALLSVSLPGIAEESIVTRERPALESVPAKVARYVTTVFARYDQNGDGRLDEPEWRLMNGEPQTMDRDHDGAITLPEFQTHVLAYGRARAPAPVSVPTDDAPGIESSDDETAISSEATLPNGSSTEVPQGAQDDSRPATPPRTTKFVVRASRGLGKLPGWFLSRDGDGDGQLTLREFSADSAGRLREFERLDRNSDGVITPREASAPRVAE